MKVILIIGPNYLNWDQVSSFGDDKDGSLLLFMAGDEYPIKMPDYRAKDVSLAMHKASYEGDRDIDGNTRWDVCKIVEVKKHDERQDQDRG